MTVTFNTRLPILTVIGWTKFAPVTVSKSPLASVVGENPLTIGGGIMVSACVATPEPPHACTTGCPESVCPPAPSGNVAIICVGERTLTLEAVMPPILTDTGIAPDTLPAGAGIKFVPTKCAKDGTESR